ncbi:hypothetical protein [Rhodococcus erythropolis]|uniref:hypothetical protein n=1 Tax=Rhodococcus erythropolis TaxID=1833 RepID=UPI0012D45519|nr:hypothetical protein [Rhodococcus erythropolis]
MFLDERLRAANEPPGVRDAIVDDLVNRLDNIGKRASEQIGQLRSPSARRIPDAYFHHEEEVENALQKASAGIRVALSLGGLPANDAHSFEADFASVLATSARWAVRCEASRVPRPLTRSPALDWTLTPIPWHENKLSWPPVGAVDLAATRQLTGADAELVRVAEQPYVDWVQLGLIERQRTFSSTHPDVPARKLIVVTGLEAADGPVPFNSMPLFEGPPNAWTDTYDRSKVRSDADTFLRKIQGPLAGIADYSGQPGAPNLERGAGLHPFPLVPRLEIIAHLGLRPEDPAVRHALVDEHGPALVGRFWRGFLIHDGNYSALEPAVHGTDLIIRPDLFDRLESVIGKERVNSGITVSYYEEGRGDDDDFSVD